VSKRSWTKQCECDAKAYCEHNGVWVRDESQEVDPLIGEMGYWSMGPACSQCGRAYREVVEVE
jgi:hypothetical protein